MWDHSFETQFREIPEKFSGNFSPRNSSEFLQKYSLEIPEKFLGQEIPLIELREFPRNGLQEILRNGLQEFPWNGLQEIPRTWFLQMGYEKFVGKAVDIFNRFSCERLLGISADSQERFLGISADFPQNCYLGKKAIPESKQYPYKSVV